MSDRRMDKEDLACAHARTCKGARAHTHTDTHTHPMQHSNFQEIFRKQIKDIIIRDKLEVVEYFF